MNNLQFTGDDYFADKDVCSIVMEVPNSALGSGKVGLWARTLDGASGKWVQADRGARSNQTPFLAGEQNAAYLAAEPADDARFVPVFAHALEHAGGYTPAEATRVAGTCCRTSSRITQRSRQSTRTMAGHSPTTSWISSFLSFQMER